MTCVSESTIAIVKATAPALERHGLAITQRMYERLFKDPEMEALFDAAAMRSGEQPRRLAGAILAYARNIDQLHILKDALARMNDKHVMSGVRADHYPKVAAALLPAIRDVLGEEIATDEVLAAWAEAYTVLAEIMIANEEALYARAA